MQESCNPQSQSPHLATEIAERIIAEAKKFVKNGYIKNNAN